MCLFSYPRTLKLIPERKTGTIDEGHTSEHFNFMILVLQGTFLIQFHQFSTRTFSIDLQYKLFTSSRIFII